MSNLISFAQGKRWSDPLLRCPKCEEGIIREDKIKSIGQEIHYCVCDKCGYHMEIKDKKVDL